MELIYVRIEVCVLCCPIVMEWQTFHLLQNWGIVFNLYVTCSLFASSFFVVDDYVLVAKDKHGYNVEQVRAFCIKKKFCCLFSLLLGNHTYMYIFPLRVDTVICLIKVVKYFVL